ncbi:MAG: hypothetical protein KC457_37260, partial [Myxococcales bacterium]|nr:hypothetical protein [Myxococcales bacterium]
MDLEALTARELLRDPPASPTVGLGESPSVMVYPPEGGSSAPTEPLAINSHFRDFLTRAVADRREVRHLSLVVVGSWSALRPGSIVIDEARGVFLEITALAQILREVFAQLGHGPLAIIGFGDHRLLRLENAFELRDVACTLMVGITDPVAISRPVADALPVCERAAADALHGSATDSA